MKKYKVKIRRLNNTLAFFYAPNETELMSLIRDKYKIDTNVFKVKVKEVI